MRPGNEKPGIELQGTWLAVSLPCYVPHAIKRVIGEHVLTPLRLQSCTLDTTLVGHSAPVTSAIFSPHHAHTTVVTISEDRTFKVRTLLIFVLPVSFVLWVGKNTIASFEYWDQDGCLCGWLAGAGLLWVSVLLVGLYYCLNFSSVCRTCGPVLLSQL